MRPLNVPVRLAAAVVAVAAASGCMSVGDDGPGGVGRPSHSAAESGAGAPDGGTATVGGGTGVGAAATGGRPGRGGKDGKGGGKDGKRHAKAGATGKEPSDTPSAAGRSSGGKDGDPTRPAPPRTADPEPSRTAVPEPTPTREPPASPTPEPTVAEPSSSAHEPPGPQLGQREPAPRAGAPV
ncbi:hypothetical protein [Streptomyces fumanus]|uniref:hypothetical protein n=1 Tax=Streptomyces fumanus TaxID=67302 RepID=UPI0033F2D59E